MLGFARLSIICATMPAAISGTLRRRILTRTGPAFGIDGQFDLRQAGLLHMILSFGKS
jgi:hypothetical protein